MKMEDQVASVGPAKELRELGVKQDSVWVWEVNSLFNTVYLKLRAFIPDVPSKYDSYFAAYTVAELGEALPDGYSSLRRDEIWCCEDVHYELAETEANVRAKMRIYLIKEGLIEVEEIE